VEDVLGALQIPALLGLRPCFLWSVPQVHPALNPINFACRDILYLNGITI
jgi:hypothetical protein